MHSLSQPLRDLSLRATACAALLSRAPVSEHRALQVRAELREMAKELADWAKFSRLYPQDVPAVPALLAPSPMFGEVVA